MARTDLAHFIDLFSCIAVSLFNKLTYLLTYLKRCDLQMCRIDCRLVKNCLPEIAKLDAKQSRPVAHPAIPLALANYC